MTDHPVISPKKLIEVALPLDAINMAAAATKRKAPKGSPVKVSGSRLSLCENASR